MLSIGINLPGACTIRRVLLILVLLCSAKVSPTLEKEMKTELDRVAKQYGGGAGVDMTKFPEMKFTEPTVDAINSSNQ